jgi:hypothetical protein
MTPASSNRVHIKHRPDYARIVDFLKDKGLRNGEFTVADVKVSRRAINSMVNSGSPVKVGKDVNYRNTYRLAYNIEKEG